MIRSRKLREAFTTIREQESRAGKNAVWLFRLEALRVQTYMAVGNLKEAVLTLGSAKTRFQRLTAAEKRDMKSAFTRLTDELTERIYRGILDSNSFDAKGQIVEYSKILTDDRGRLAFDLFWATYYLREYRFIPALEHLEPATKSVEKLVKKNQLDFNHDTYGMILAGRILSSHIIALIRQNDTEAAEKIKEKYSVLLKPAPAVMEKIEAWFVTDVEKQKGRSERRKVKDRIIAALTPVVDRLVRAVEKGDTAVLHQLFTKSIPTLDEIVTHKRREQVTGWYWKAVSLMGDTDISAGSHVELSFEIRGSMNYRFTPRAEDHWHAGAKVDLSLDDVRDVIKQEYTESRSRDVSAAYLEAVFSFDGIEWKIERLSKP